MSDFDTVLARLREDSTDTSNLTVDDVNEVDLMHMGGKESTDKLTELAGITGGMEILDAGCGIGGTSRRIAARTGANVTGLDLTQRAVETGNRLSEHLGIAGQVEAVRGSVTDMPFDGDGFDVVIVQHCAMQVEEKDRLFGECARVLKPGGRLAMHDWFAGQVTPLRYPLPWADGPATSFLEPLDDAMRRLRAHGFVPEPFIDQTEKGVEWLTRSRANIDRRVAAGGDLTRTQQRTIGISRTMIPNLSEGRLILGFLFAQSPDKP
jgi:SAM-dependent methyltransferase